nr:tetratricopeptide repeat protein [Streptomyces sp. NBC_00899]
MAVGRAHTFNHFQASAPLTPVPLPHRIGRIPALAPHFQDRDLTASLAARPGRPLILTGTTGTGKSQLAAQYAESAWERGELRLLLWVADATRESVTAAYAQAAQDILGRYFFDQAEGAQAFLNWLRPAGGTEPRPWLVVLDGVAEPADLADGLWPPASPVGRVLVTSSRRDFDETADAHFVQVRPFGREEAVGYLRDALGRHLPDPGLTSLTTLADRLGRVPASLGRAVRHIVAEGVDVATYVQRLDDRSNGGPAVHAPLRLAIDEANRRRPAGVAAPLLQLAAVLAESGAPRDVLSSAPALALLTRLRGGVAAPVTADDVNRAVRVLYDLSLADVQEHPSATTVPVEPSVRDAVLAAAPDDLLPDLVRTAANALAAVWPEAEGSVHLARLLRANTWELLKGSAGDVLLRDGIHPVAFRSGRSAGEWGKAVEAADYFHQLAHDAGAVLGPDHPDVLNACSCAAQWRGEGGDLRGAVEELTQVLERQQRVGDDLQGTLTTRHRLAGFRTEMTEGGTDAMTELAVLLKDRERALGPDHLDTLETRRELVRGHLLSLRTEFEAEAHAVLAAVERVAGADHRQTFAAREVVVIAHLYGGSADTAYAVAKQRAADALRVFGPDHLVTLGCRSWVLAAALGRGEDEVFAAELAALLGDEQRLLGSDHPETLDSRAMSAQCRRDSGDVSGALQDYFAVLTDRRRVLGADHPRSLDTLASVADCYGRCGEPVSAVVALSELVACRVRVLGPDHPDTLSARSSLGRWRGEAGDAVGAVIDLAAVVADLTRVLGPDDAKTFVARHNLAWYRGEAGDLSGAVAAFTEVLADREAVNGPEHHGTVATRNGLAKWQREAAAAASDTDGETAADDW